MTPTEVITYLEGIRWPNGVISPFRKDSKVYVHPIPNTYVCKYRNRQFTVLTNTILSGNRKNIAKWWIFIDLLVKNTPEIDIAAELQLSDTTIYGMYKTVFKAFEIVMPIHKKDLYPALRRYLARQPRTVDGIFKQLLKNRRVK